MRWLAWTMLMAAVLGAASLNDELNPVRTHPHGAADTAVERLIIKLREAASATAVIAAAVTPEEAQIEAGRQRVALLAGRHGLMLKSTRASSPLRRAAACCRATASFPIRSSRTAAHALGRTPRIQAIG